ncbi:hypothetical protein [Desulfopila sp. IMCC35008]|uniref:hypothetical protein n=1 Tax=Desulfopila sp. IMCC35008 TaxID=2653858 RepID=UPI0013D65C2E|nr:hypothetical protein [Desulfopila sp. IMCC35008]
MKELSSSLTFFYKYIVILIWIAGFGFGTREVLLAGPSDPKWIQYMVIWVLFATFIFFTTGNIKKVSLGKEGLIVSNFLKEVEIQVADIETVDGSTYLSPRLVWFTLKNNSPFGRKISFIPERRMSPGIGKHPLVVELNKLFDL